jgi:predicted nucleic-acid-binding protein
MTTSYGADRPTVARVIEGLLGAPQLRIQAAETAWLALLDYRESQVDFSDALTARLARAAGCVHVSTLDGRLAGSAGFRLLDER